MYNTRTEFEEAVFSCNPPYWDKELFSIEVAWRVYRNTTMKSKFDFLVMGRWVTYSTPNTPGIDVSLMRNLHVMDETYFGAPIMNCSSWTLFVNDAWLLGGIHNFAQFQLASFITIGNIYQTQGKFSNQLTVTGREVAGLKTFGYIKRGLLTGSVFVCTDLNRANSANFNEYLHSIKYFSENNRWMNLL